MRLVQSHHCLIRACDEFDDIWLESLGFEGKMFVPKHQESSADESVLCFDYSGPELNRIFFT
jgi:hypothetical protein